MLFVECGNIELLYLIIRGHICRYLAAFHFWQVSCSIVERFEVRAYSIAQVCNHSLCILGKLACAFLQMIDSHFSTNGKNFGVNANVHLSAQLLTHTIAEFCVTLISNKTVTARFGWLNLLFGLYNLSSVGE